MLPYMGEKIMRHTHFLSSLLAASLLAASPAMAAEPDAAVATAVADEGRLADNRKLDAARQPAVVLDFAQVKRGSTVADLLAGNGYFSEMLADLVGADGTVVPLNTPGFHDAAVWAGLQKSHANLKPKVSEIAAMDFAPGSLDMMFTHLVYHDMYWESEKFKYPRIDVDPLVAGWFRALRPGGTVVIVDHVGPAGDTRAIVEKMHRIDPATVRADMERAGFVFDAASDALHVASDDHSLNVFDPAIRGKTDRFMMRFRKPV